MLPVNAVILQRNGSGQGQTTHPGVNGYLKSMHHYSEKKTKRKQENLADFVFRVLEASPSTKAWLRLQTDPMPMFSKQELKGEDLKEISLQRALSRQKQI